MKVGSFLKGVGSGLQMFPQIQELKWKKAERKAIEKEKEDWKEAISIFQGKLDEYSSATNLSYGEQIEIISWASALGHEYMNVMQDLMSDVNQGNREGAKRKHELLKAYTDFTLSTGFPIEGGETILSKDTMRYIQQGNLLKETGGKTGEAMGRQTWKERGFGEIPVTEVPKLTDTQVKLAEIDKFNFLTEERRNKMKVQLLVKDSAWAEKVKDARAAGATDVDIVEMAGGGVIGAEPIKEKTIPDPTSIENIRSDILNADTFEDAQRIYKNYADKYDEKSLMINLPKDWADVKQGDLMDLISVLNEMTAGTLEGRNVKGNKKFTFNIDGEETTKTGAEWYNAVYESYIALIKLLEEFDIDISQYKKLKPLSEIKKIKFGGFVGEGVETGDLIKIYY